MCSKGVSPYPPSTVEWLEADTDARSSGLPEAVGAGAPSPTPVCTSPSSLQSLVSSSDECRPWGHRDERQWFLQMRLAPVLPG